MLFNFADHLEQQIAWSEATFGPRSERGPIGPLCHLLKELKEIEADPADIMEWADACFLVIDASWRANSLVPASAWWGQALQRDALLLVKSTAEDLIAHGGHLTMTYLDLLWSILGSARYYGHTPEALGEAMRVKLAVNKLRSWPDRRTHPAGQPIEHVRTEPSPKPDVPFIWSQSSEQYTGPQSDLTPRPTGFSGENPELHAEWRAKAQSLANQLGSAFIWSHTSQGLYYWVKVVGELQALAGSK